MGLHVQAFRRGDALRKKKRKRNRKNSGGGGGGGGGGGWECQASGLDMSFCYTDDIQDLNNAHKSGRSEKVSIQSRRETLNTRHILKIRSYHHKAQLLVKNANG